MLGNNKYGFVLDTQSTSFTVKNKLLLIKMLKHLCISRQGYKKLIFKINSVIYFSKQINISPHLLVEWFEEKQEKKFFRKGHIPE